MSEDVFASQPDNKQKLQHIENWFRHADDHLKHYAFNHARQALQNVLRLNPGNKDALQRISEVDRRESEYRRAHLEKEQGYRAALEAWERGDVTTAFNNLERVIELDRRAPDRVAGESAVPYEKLYQEVRSEHDRINNAHQEAQKRLAGDDFDGALSICDRILNKYQGHPLFQGLKEDIGERQRQYVSAYIIKIDRDVEAEPDLNRKAARLAEALRLYPQEKHFSQQLDNINRRRDLVAGIESKVDDLEARGQYQEALSQLEVLRSIHPQSPGLALEIDRITKRRDQHLKSNSKNQRVDQIDAAMEAGDFSEALTLLKSALTDLPNDAELLAQERIAQDGQNCALEALRVFEQARKQCEQGDAKAGLESLWKAFGLDNRNRLIRTSLVETLLKRAATELEAAPATSEEFVAKAIELDPGNRQAIYLQRLIRDRQNDRAIDLALSRSRKEQASGDLSAALAVLQRALDSFPDDPRLLARKEALLKIAGPIPKPSEVSSEPPVTVAQEELIPTASDTSAPRRRTALVLVAVAIVLLISIVAFRFARSTRRPPAVTAEIAINASVPGAHILVDGKDVGIAPVTFKLSEGQHSIDGALPGYSSKQPISIGVGAGATPPPSTLNVVLDPLPSMLFISTELQQASLDDEKLVFDGTGFQKTSLENGPHVLRLSSPVVGSITVEFEMSTGQIPVVHKVANSDTLVVAIATLLDHGQVYTSSKSLKLGFNAAVPQLVGDSSMPVELAPGANPLVIDDSKTATTVAVDVKPNPSLTIFVGAQPNVGTFEITETANVDATVSIAPDDESRPSRTQNLKNGKTAFLRLEPKTYLVEVSAPGYETERLSVPVSKGTVARASVSLKAIPATATLMISGGTAEADVLIDSALIGKLNATGGYTNQVSPGKHRIQLRKADFEDSAAIDLEFAAGAAVRLNPNDVALKPLGWIEFNVSPPSSTITYHPVGATGNPVTAKNGDKPHVKAGRYSITVSSNGFQPYTEDSFEVEAGKGKPFERTLVPIATTRVAPPPAIFVGKEGIDAARPEVPFNLFRQRLPGSYSFKIRLRRAGLLGKRARWVVNFVDMKNYIEYEMDDKNLKYTTHKNGREQTKSVPHRITGSNADVYDVTVSVSANEISISSGGQQIPIETPPGSENLLAGNFGFPKDETVDMDTFRFNPSR